MKKFSIIKRAKMENIDETKKMFHNTIKQQNCLTENIMRLVYANLESLLYELKYENNIIFEETNIYNLKPEGSYIIFDKPSNMEKYYNLYKVIEILLNKATANDRNKEIELMAEVNGYLKFVLSSEKTRYSFKNSLIKLISKLNDINNNKISEIFYNYLYENYYHLSFIEDDQLKLIEVTNNMILKAILENYDDIKEEDLY